MNIASTTLAAPSANDSILDMHMQSSQVVEIVDYLERLQEHFEAEKRMFDGGIIATAIQLVQKEFHTRRSGEAKESIAQ